MKKKSNITSLFIKHFTFALLLVALSAKPFSQAITLFSDLDYELVSLALDQDIEEENKEIDTENEKIEVQIVKPNTPNYEENYTSKFTHHCLLFSTFSSKIHSPPPEIV